MFQGRKWKLVLVTVSVVLLLIVGIILIKSINETSSKSGNANIYNPSSTPTGDFKSNLVNDEYLLVKSSLTWEKFSEKFKEGDEELINGFSKLFYDLKWTGVFFECKPFKPSEAKTETVEFRLVKTNAFDGVKMDHSNFDEQFKSKCPVGTDAAAISFLNLNKKSTLVSPCPTSRLNGTHIKSFMSSANFEQKKALLVKVGEIFSKKILGGGDEKIWLSTSGLGVSWLHVRFDPEPKYYQTIDYKI